MSRTTLGERRSRLARRLLELRPHRPPFAEAVRWRTHHGQRAPGETRPVDILDGLARFHAEQEARLGNRIPPAVCIFREV